MNEELILVNDVLKNETEGSYERVLWIDKEYKLCYTIKLFTSKINIKNRNIDDIERKIENGITSILEKDPLFRIIDSEELPKKDKELMNNAYEIVMYIASKEKEPQCFFGKNRSKLIIQAIEKFNINRKTIYKYLRKYWQGGKIKNSLATDFYKCGTNKERKCTKKKLGRPSNLSLLQGDSIGINVDEDVKRIFKVSLARFFHNKKERSLANTYRLMLDNFYTEEVEENDVTVLKIKSIYNIPSERQFKYWYYNTRDIENEKNKRIGEAKFNLKYRGLNSDSIFETIGPGFRYQIDATIADVYLVSRINRKSIIGRPVVYLAVDVFSHLIVGLHVCLEGPSWNGASSLIYNCFENKKEFCAKYGINIDNSEWPVEGLPRVILADNGETVGPIAEGIVSNLGISLENAPSYRGDAKGIVEQYFHVINTKIKHWLPGEVKREYRERGERDYRLDAKLDIFQFTQIIIYAVLNKNKSLMNKYPMTQEMIDDGIDSKPIEIWNWGLKNKSGILRTFSDELVRLNLMRHDRAVVTARGIEFNGMLYSCEMAEIEKWFSKARTNGWWYVDILYDNREMTSINLVDSKANIFTTCFLRERISSTNLFVGKTFEEIVDYNFMKGVRNMQLKDNMNENQFTFDNEVSAIIKESEAMSGTEKRNIIDIKENRRIENMDLRKKQSLSTNQNMNNIEKIQKANNINEAEAEDIQKLSIIERIKHLKEGDDLK